MKIKGNMAKAMKFTPDILGKDRPKLWVMFFIFNLFRKELLSYHLSFSLTSPVLTPPL